MVQMRRAARRIQLSLLLWVITSIVVSACAATPTPASEATPTAASENNPRSATLSDLAGSVAGRATRAEVLAPVSLGFQLSTGGQVQTGDDSRARLDFSDASILRLSSNSAYTLEGVETESNGSVTARVQLTFGKIWVSVFGGAVEVETPVGVASVRGSFATFQYAPGDPNNPDDDLLLIDCLEGTCTAQNGNVNEQLGNLERLVLNSRSSLRQTLTENDVLLFLLENPESDRLVPTLTAAPPATATPTEVLPTATRTATALPPTATRTLAPATLIIPVSGATATATATLTPTSIPPTPAFRLLGTHAVRPQETFFCIGRGYGVLPAAIALANNRPLDATLSPGTRLNIPAIQWDGIPAGPVCAPQFGSPFPGLPVSTATPTLTHTPLPSLTPTQPPVAAPTDTSVPVPPTLTFTPIPPTLTPTPTLSPTPTPDVQGPSISNFDGSLNYQVCAANFAVDIFDVSGVPAARVDWAVFDSNNRPFQFAGSGGLSPDGLTWFGVTPPIIVPSFGYVSWTVVATDTLGNITLATAPIISETTGFGMNCIP